MASKVLLGLSGQHQALYTVISGRFVSADLIADFAEQLLESDVPYEVFPDANLSTVEPSEFDGDWLVVIRVCLCLCEPIVSVGNSCRRSSWRRYTF